MDISNDPIEEDKLIHVNAESTSSTVDLIKGDIVNAAASAQHDAAAAIAREMSKDIKGKDKDGPSHGEDLASILAEDVAAERDMLEKRMSLGLDHPETLAACIRMLESWIGLYKLKPMDDLIGEILHLCKKHDETLYVKCLQMKAFLKYKQFKFREALDLFYEFKELVGSSAELLENMGHTHNTLNEHDKALECFQEALSINKIKSTLNPSFDLTEHSGGLLLGIGTSYKRMNKNEEALKYLLEALQLYKKRFEHRDHSLIAKALTGIADAYTRLKKPVQAHKSHLEAVRIFKVTCGVSPLTANALIGLAQGAMALNNYVEAALALDEALALHVNFDTLDLPQIIIVCNLIMEVKPKLLNKPFPTPSSPPLSLHAAFSRYTPDIRACVRSIEMQGKSDEDDSAVFYKAGGELLMLGGELRFAVQLIQRAKELFEKVTSIDCTGLINTCDQLISTARHVAERDGKVI